MVLEGSKEETSVIKFTLSGARSGSRVEDEPSGQGLEAESV